ERLSSKKAKEALANRIRLFDISSVSALPEGTVEIFNRFFGEKHFSLKCITRSACVSLGGMFFFWLLFVLISPRGWKDTVFLVTAWDEPTMRDYDTYKMWIPFSLIPDYFNLFKTRVLLRLLSSTIGTNPAILAITVVLDFVVGSLIFWFFYQQIAGY